MKKLFILFISVIFVTACKKESTSKENPIQSTTITTNTKDTSNNTIDTVKYVTDGTVSIGKPISKVGNGLKDIDGNKYKSVFIGSQEWMAENLNVTRYNDGTIIPNVSELENWRDLVKTKAGAWCYYKNNDSLGLVYGKLYNWFVVSPKMNGNKNVCPSGWHVPLWSEWTILFDYVGKYGFGKLKEVGLKNWISPNTGATNSFLFSGLPGGYRDFTAFYFGIGLQGIWWSSSELNTNDASGMGVSNDDLTPTHFNFSKNSGFSVRCVKD